jgi:hypothetical protein
MNKWRRSLIADSNYPENPNMNACTKAVCDALMVTDKVRYLHTLGDCERALKKKYKLVEHTNEFLNKTISSIRQDLKAESAHVRTFAYFVFTYMMENGVEVGHVILLDKNGKTLVDSMDMHNGYDKRKVSCIHAITPKLNKEVKKYG